MENSENKKSKIEKTAEDLLEFAIDREDVKWLLERLPPEADIQRTTVEYELQILKIIGVGWSISYFLADSHQKNVLLKIYWNAINEFSGDLTKTMQYLIGQDIDYFQVLKDRLALYVDAMAQHPDALEPAEVIGRQFSKNCGSEEDIFTFMTGSKMFISATTKVRQYLEAIKLR
ncbi:MAG: hypothetical protein PVH42_22950 [Desulfobacterales bacterium]|jgi:hypothetical protein